MSITQVGKGSFAIDVRVGGRGGKRVRFQRQCPRQEAERLEAEIKARLLAGDDWSPETQGSTEGMTLGQAYDRMMREVWDQGRSSRSYHGSTGKVTVQTLGRGLPLKDVNETRLQFLVDNSRLQGQSPRTINAKLAIIGAIMRRARDVWGLDIRVPNFRALRQKESKGRIRWLDKEEEHRLITAAGRDMADLVSVLLDTGARLSEVLNLEWRDVDLERGKVHLWKTKADRPRTIPMTSRVKAVFRRRRGEDRPFSLTKDQVMREWRKIRKGLGMDDDPEFVVHMLRHTCASRLVQAGVPLTTVRDWLGHASVTMTERYAHLAPDHMEQARAALDARNANV